MNGSGISLELGLFAVPPSCPPPSPASRPSKPGVRSGLRDRRGRPQPVASLPQSGSLSPKSSCPSASAPSAEPPPPAPPLSPSKMSEISGSSPSPPPKRRTQGFLLFIIIIIISFLLIAPKYPRRSTKPMLGVPKIRPPPGHRKAAAPPAPRRCAAILGGNFPQACPCSGTAVPGHSSRLWGFHRQENPPSAESKKRQ